MLKNRYFVHVSIQDHQRVYTLRQQITHETGAKLIPEFLFLKLTIPLFCFIHNGQTKQNLCAVAQYYIKCIVPIFN